ncbi:LolA family protein [Bacillus sp. FJAT-45037]|uniref:LolA family protein n=1 Tax=Bacillus sp. FJAT-45037 TaxID=2011007 RepID=UPI000C24C5DC|nr:outer membrane lipoprotein carrier protein LolA [Bacillus sp. FJAT-45037]
MKRLTAIFSLATAILFTTACSVEDTEKIIEQAVEAQENLDSYYAEVSSTFEYGGESETSTYKEWNMKQNKHRTEMENGYLHVSNGKESWSYDENENTVTVFETTDEMLDEMPTEAEMMREMLTEMLNSTDVKVNGRDTIAEQKTIHLSVSTKDGEEDQFMGDMSYDIWIDEETYMPLKMEWVSEDFSSMMEYTHIEYNIDIDEDLFSFEIPDGAEVLTMDDFMMESLSLEELSDSASFMIPNLDSILETHEFNEANYFEEMDMATLHFNQGDEFIVLSITTEKTEMMEETEPVTTENFEGSYMNMFDTHFLFWSNDDVYLELMTTSQEMSKENLVDIAAQIQ